MEITSNAPLFTLTIEQFTQLCTTLLDERIRHFFKEHLEDQRNSAMSIEQAAKYLKIKLSTLYNYTSNGKIPHEKDGKFLMFHKEALDEWAASNSRRKKKTKI